jgi:hypothetical protein
VRPYCNCADYNVLCPPFLSHPVLPVPQQRKHISASFHHHSHLCVSVQNVSPSWSAFYHPVMLSRGLHVLGGHKPTVTDCILSSKRHGLKAPVELTKPIFRGAGPSWSVLPRAPLQSSSCRMRFTGEASITR